MKKFNLTFVLMILSLQALCQVITPYKNYYISPVSDSHYRLENRNSKVIQGNDVELGRLNDFPSEVWKIDPYREGYVLRTLSNENFVLEMDNSLRDENDPLSLNDPDWVCIKQFNGHPRQIWLMEETSPGIFIFRNADNKDLALTQTGRTNLMMAKYTGDENQKWRVEFAEPIINIEKDKNGQIILAPHSYIYKTRDVNYYITFYPYNEPGECDLGIENDQSRAYNSIYGEIANYTRQGNMLTIKDKKGVVWKGTISDDGRSLVMKNGNTTRKYIIEK